MSVAAGITQTHIEVHTPKRLAGLVAEIPGSRYVPGGDLWRLPRTFNALVQLYAQLADTGELGMSDELQQQIGFWKADEEMQEIQRLVCLDPEMWEPRTETHLYGYQDCAAGWMIGAGSAVLGDDPGTGKTEMAIAWLGDPHQALIVCPRGVQQHWLQSLQRRCPEHTHMVLPATAAQRRKTLTAYLDLPQEVRGALIVTYSQLPLHSRLAGYGSIRLDATAKEPKEFNAVAWTAVIADEAHRAFHPETKHTRALWWLGDRAARRLAMTGTPSESSPLDFWALLRFAAPDEWPSRSKFQAMYCETKLNFWGGTESVRLKPETAAEFHRLANRRFLRRPKSLVLPFLPVKTYETRTVEMTPKIRKQYTQLAKEMVVELAGGQLVVTEPMVLHGRLIQAANATLEITGQEPYINQAGEEMVRDVVRMCEPSPTVDALLEAYDDLGRQPCAVFAASRQLLELASTRLGREGVGHVKIVGGMHSYEIEEAREAYNTGQVDVILISVGATSEGLSLTRGSLEFWLDRHARRLVNVQGEDRMHGTGRGDEESDRLLIVDLIVADTVENRVHERLLDKDNQFEELFSITDL